MRARLTRIGAMAVGLALAGAALAPTGAGAAKSAISDKYCTAFAEYYTVSIVVEFGAALAQTFNNLPGDTKPGSKPVDPDELRATTLLVFSPKMEALTGQMARGGEKVLRPTWRTQHDVFARGVGLLRGTGFTDRQIAAIATVKIEPGTATIADLTDPIDVSKAKIEAAGRTFKRELDKVQLDGSPKVSDAFERAGSQCGVFPSITVPCEKVFPPSRAAEILGAKVTQEDKDCDYNAPEPAVGTTPSAAVVLYDSTRALDLLTQSIETEKVAGIGERALAFNSYSANGHGKTCGRTLIVAEGNRTVSVALCLADDAAVTDTQLIGIANDVFARLAKVG